MKKVLLDDRFLAVVLLILFIPIHLFALGEIPAGKPVYVMCQSGLRSYIACRILIQNGFECFNFSGGFGFYESITGDKVLTETSYPCGMDK